MKTIQAADLFCGAGGTSLGLLMATNEMEVNLNLVAINHWSVAIDTHSTNHPYAQHVCTGLDSVDPRKLVPGGRLNVMCASPECTHFSGARGGKPCSDQSRASAWHVLRFAEALYIENIIIENVREFLTWGPLGANGRPLKSKKGQLFEQFVSSLKALGYNVEWKVLNCADYGDPTTRERLFVIARRNGKPIRWPKPTHIPPAEFSKALFAESRLPWRTAREIIDWTIPSRSIFGRKKPLADNTIRRIQAGIRKFWGFEIDLQRCMAEDLRPFLVVFRNNQDAASIDKPIPTLTTSGANIGLISPLLVGHPRQKDGKSRTSIHPVDEPMRTVTATSSDFSLVEPFVIPQHGGGIARDFDSPIPTVATKGAIRLVQPLLMQIDQAGGSGVLRPVDAPLATLVTKENTALIEPFIATVNHGDGDERRTRSIDSPMATVTGSMGEAVCTPFLIAYYGTQNMSSVSEPLPTATTKDRFGVVEANVDRYMLDIRFRMLTPRELARAQGFPDSYKFSGKREDVVKQIGNAVPPNTAKALIMAQLAGEKVAIV